MSSHQYGEEEPAAAAVTHNSTSTQIDTLLQNENFHISSVQAMLLNPEASNDSTDIRIAELSELLFDPTENSTDDMNLQSTTTAKETLFQKAIKNNKKRCSMGEPTNITNISQYEGSSAFWTLARTHLSSLETTLSEVEKVLSDLDQEYLMGKTDTNTTTLGSTSQPSIALQLLRSLFFDETNIQPTEAMSINCEQRMIQRASSSKVLDVTNIRKLFSREDYENEKFNPSDKSISPKVWLLFDKILRICSVSVKGNIPEHIRKKQGKRMIGAMKGKGVNSIAMICSLCGGHYDDGLLVKGGVYQPKQLEGLYETMSNWHTTHYPNCPCKNDLSEQDLHTLT